MSAAARPFASATLVALLLGLWPGMALAQAAHAAAAFCAEPALIGDGWERSGPEESGFDAQALCQALGDVANGETNIHSVVVERHGRLVAELYRRGRDRPMNSLFTREVDFGPTVLHDMRSVSKSMVGLLVGIVQQQGRIAGLDTPVLDFYPELGDLRSPARDAITLEHLLSMSSGLQWNEGATTYGTLANDETRLYWAWSISRYVMSRPIDASPGVRFNYNGGGTAVLADILARVTHTGLRELVRAELFAPLGIEQWEWAGDLYGRPAAFAGLRMRPRDLAKIGRMLLDHGAWHGRQVVPAAWVEMSLRPHLAIDDDVRYGFQWWVGSSNWKGEAITWSAAIGNGGQRLFVLPALDLAVVVTAGDYNDANIGRTVNRLFSRIVATVRE